MNKIKMPSDVSIITTYRCNMECKMCDIWRNPTNKKYELTAEDLEKLPNFKFTNITGGEPFMRRDIEDIIEVMYRKSDRVVISTAGWHTAKILKMAERFPKIGVRVSLEGMEEINNDLRGRDTGFQRGLEMGIKDIGFGMTVSNKNSHDLINLYDLSKQIDMEFATATFHNSFYFHKDDNEVTNKDEVISNFEQLIDKLLKDNNPKSWYRAYFNLGLINYIKGQKRMLPCEAGTVNFFIEPYGDVYPCNGLEKKYWKESMGNIRDHGSFEDLWFSEQANKVRGLVRTCPKNCWMVGTAAPVMKKYIKHPTAWVVKNKIKSLIGKPVCKDHIPYADVGQDPLQGDLREVDVNDL